MTEKSFAPIPNIVLRRRDVSHGAKLCLARIIQYAGKECVAFPRISTLAIEVGISHRHVQRLLIELQEHDLIKIVRRGKGLTNAYILNSTLYTELEK